MMSQITKRAVTVTRWESDQLSRSYASARSLAKALLMQRRFSNYKGYIDEYDCYHRPEMGYPARSAGQWERAVRQVELAIKTMDGRAVEEALTKADKELRGNQ